MRGFTLLELSIVLVIIGLIVGGITVGSDMIRAAELRGTISQAQEHHAAVLTFKDKYFHLPGDMPNAFDFWGTAGSCTNVHSDLTGAGCNGDGNRQLTYSDSESYRAWQHLSLSGMVAGGFSGVVTTDPYVPTTKMPSGEIQFHYRSPLDANVFEIAGAGTGVPRGVLFTPAEAWNFDKKVDDGLPHRGALFGWGGHDGSIYSITCLDTGGTYAFPTTASAGYNLAVETPECRIIWMVAQ